MEFERKINQNTINKAPVPNNSSNVRNEVLLQHRPNVAVKQSGDLISETASDLLSEKHYTCSELANLWNVSPDLIRRLFANELGVIVIYKPHPDRRPYRSLRVPESVAIRVYQKMSLSQPRFEVRIR